MVGDIRAVVDNMREMHRSQGWDDSQGVVMTLYDTTTRTMTATPMAKTSVTSRLRALLQTHLGMDTQRLKKFASHTMRRGGATYYAALGLSDATI